MPLVHIPGSVVLGAHEKSRMVGRPQKWGLLLAGVKIGLSIFIRDELVEKIIIALETIMYVGNPLVKRGKLEFSWEFNLGLQVFQLAWHIVLHTSLALGLQFLGLGRCTGVVSHLELLEKIMGNWDPCVNYSRGSQWERSLKRGWQRSQKSTCWRVVPLLSEWREEFVELDPQNQIWKILYSFFLLLIEYYSLMIITTVVEFPNSQYYTFRCKFVGTRVWERVLTSKGVLGVTYHDIPIGSRSSTWPNITGL